MRFVVTRIPWFSSAARLHTDGGRYYAQGVVVTRQRFGRRLRLQMWIGDLPSIKEWRAAARQHFPRARTAVIERMLEDGTLQRRPPIRLQPPDWIERFFGF